LITKIGIVVPTLGKRADYLQQCLSSIRAAGDAYILLVAPSDFNPKELLSRGLIDQFIVDPKGGLPAAINLGISELPQDVQFTNWLGDDDMLAPNSLITTSQFFESNPDVVLVFGSCQYVDPKGKVLWTNRSGQWAVPLLRFGPDLIPQPGALFRRQVFQDIKGLSSDYDWAFDFDLFIRLSKAGSVRFIPETLASFRWHPESLSVEFRAKSVEEASLVRVSHLPAVLRWLSGIWEYPVKQATLIAGSRVNSKARKIAQGR
jgi:GT2 family glycosyltransferase